MVFKIFNLTLLIYSGVEVRFESASQQIDVFVCVSIACIAHDYFRLSHQQITNNGRLLIFFKRDGWFFHILPFSIDFINLCEK